MTLANFKVLQLKTIFYTWLTLVFQRGNAFTDRKCRDRVLTADVDFRALTLGACASAYFKTLSLSARHSYWVPVPVSMPVPVPVHGQIIQDRDCSEKVG